MNPRSPLAWWTRANCHNDQHTFDACAQPYPTKNAIHAAKQICAPCPVKQQCLTDALRTELPTHNASGRYSIRGGYTPLERETIARAVKDATP